MKLRFYAGLMAILILIVAVIAVDVVTAQTPTFELCDNRIITAPLAIATPAAWDLGGVCFFDDFTACAEVNSFGTCWDFMELNGDIRVGGGFYYDAARYPCYECRQCRAQYAHCQYLPVVFRGYCGELKPRARK